MAGDWLFSLTLITNFLSMAISLWFAIYLLARSLTNPVTFRAVIVLIALVFYFHSSFSEMTGEDVYLGVVRSLATLIALIAINDVTHFLLPEGTRIKLFWLSRVILLGGVVAVILLFSPVPSKSCDPTYICPASVAYPWVIVDLFKVLVFASIMHNVWVIVKNEYRYQVVPLYGALILGGSPIFFSLLSTLFDVILPRFVVNLLVLCALALTIYGVWRDKILVAQKKSTYELPVTTLTVIAITSVYAWVAWHIGLDGTGILLIVLLAIFSHSVYDFVRELLERAMRQQERHVRQELRPLAHQEADDLAFPDVLQQVLNILCDNLHTSRGWIALREGEGYEVTASILSYPIGTLLSAKEIGTDAILQLAKVFEGYTYQLISAEAGMEQLAVIGIGNRLDHQPFSQDDLYWLEEIGDDIAWMIHMHRMHKSWVEVGAVDNDTGPAPMRVETLEAEKLILKVAHKPDLQLVKHIEEGYRSLNDYSTLGKSPLVQLLGIQAHDHIEAGKLVQRKLTEVIEKLRPAGDPPCEPLPREWYAYTILHDAYIEDRMTRDIMGKLYISEGTYFRMRRHALRGVTRALLEGIGHEATSQVAPSH
jgi:hypothetical protein